MRTFLIKIAIVAGLLTVGLLIGMNADGVPVLSETQHLKWENHVLRIQLLRDEEGALIGEFRQTLHAGPDDVFHGDTLTFTPPVKP